MPKLNSTKSKKEIKSFIQNKILSWKRDNAKQRYHNNREYFCEYQREYRVRNLEKVRKRER
jgi:hypothetical protein|tara:strand:- start:580 stop:762 length:183 start_codon:yes stop_codon:yes gene_type:complete